MRRGSAHRCLVLDRSSDSESTNAKSENREDPVFRDRCVDLTLQAVCKPDGDGSEACLHWPIRPCNLGREGRKRASPLRHFADAWN